MANVPKACNGWGEAMSAYRFFDNDSIERQAILEPHWRHTEHRVTGQAAVLCLQVTTELDLNGQQGLGLGPLSYEAQRGNMFIRPMQ
jgi:hypothetical protein